MTSVKDCEACGSATKVYKTVICDEGVKRTRQCLACNVRYDTIETRVAPAAVTYDEHEEEPCDEHGSPLPKLVVP